MPKLINATDTERAFAAAALLGMPAGAGVTYERVVDVVVSAIDSLRQGDPVGTIRRAPIGGVIVERRVNTETGERYWHRLVPEGQKSDGLRWSQAVMGEWGLLFMPPPTVGAPAGGGR